MVAPTGAWSGWQRRPILSASLRVAATLVPVAASLGVALALNQVLPSASDIVPAIGRSLGLLLCSLAALVITDVLARRFLPLAALLQLSLVFPDQTPSRFKTALKGGSGRRLAREVDLARRDGISDDPTPRRRAAVDAGDGDRRPRPPHQGSRRARPLVHRADRRRAPHLGGRARQAPVGGADPRHRQDRGPDQDPQQEGPTRRQRVVDPPTSPSRRRTLGDAGRVVAGRRGPRRRRSPRAVGRHRLSPRARGRRHSTGGRDRGGRRRVRGDDRRALVQGGDAARRRACRAHPLRRHSLQPRGGASPAERLDRSSPAVDGRPRGAGPSAIPRSGDQGRGVRAGHGVDRGRIHDVHRDGRRRNARRHGRSRRRPAPAMGADAAPSARTTFEVPAYLQAVPVPPTETSVPVAPVAVPDIEIAAASTTAPPSVEVPTTAMAPTNIEMVITTTTPSTTPPRRRHPTRRSAPTISRRQRRPTSHRRPSRQHRSRTRRRRPSPKRSPPNRRPLGRR